MAEGWRSAARKGQKAQAQDYGAPEESREQVLHSRVTGRIAEWKGKFGWIEPDQPIAHWAASRRNGKVFLSLQDVEAEISGIGAPVSFLVYADGTGCLGAMNVRPEDEGSLKSKAFAGRTYGLNGGTSGGGKGKSKGDGGGRDDGGGKGGSKGDFYGDFYGDGGGNGGFKGDGGGKAGPKGDRGRKGGSKGDAGGKGGLFGDGDDWAGYFGDAGDWGGFFGGGGDWGGFFGGGGKGGSKGDKGWKGGSKGDKGWKGGFQDDGDDWGGLKGDGGGKGGSKGDSDWKGGSKGDFKGDFYGDGGGKGGSKGDGGGKGGKKGDSGGKDGKKGGKKGGDGLRKSERQRVGDERATGEVEIWKGNMAWILPHEPVNHPQWQGKIFLHISDMEGEIKVPEGSKVSFFVYADGTGLGAEGASLLTMSEVEEVEAKYGSQGDMDDASEEPKKKKKKTTVLWSAAKTAETVAATPAAALAKKASPNLPRERITDVPTCGEVIRWNTGYGWIKLYQPVEHDLAKPDGSIFVGMRDLVGMSNLETGMLVTFHIFADESGLGAEECTEF